MTSISAFGQGSGHWECNPYDYQYDMSVYAEVTIDGTKVDPATVELAAFAGNECRGVAEALELPGGSTIYSMRVRSNQASGENITFKAWANGEEISVGAEEPVVFESAALIGMPSHPLVLSDNNGFVLMGDANNDGVVTVTDITVIVLRIMEEPLAEFNEVAADVNGDGYITVSDIIGVVNIILED